MSPAVMETGDVGVLQRWRLVMWESYRDGNWWCGSPTGMETGDVWVIQG